MPDTLLRAGGVLAGDQLTEAVSWSAKLSQCAALLHRGLAAIADRIRAVHPTSADGTRLRTLFGHVVEYVTFVAGNSVTWRASLPSARLLTGCWQIVSLRWTASCRNLHGLVWETKCELTLNVIWVGLW